MPDFTIASFIRRGRAACGAAIAPVTADATVAARAFLCTTGEASPFLRFSGAVGPAAD
jgi:hypothetical protein